tara:strand:+ start:122 stop:250 length:129 start_codon:yes stop_codon:yes gene_type:complete
MHQFYSAHRVDGMRVVQGAAQNWLYIVVNSTYDVIIVITKEG